MAEISKEQNNLRRLAMRAKLQTALEQQRINQPPPPGLPFEGAESVEARRLDPFSVPQLRLPRPSELPEQGIINENLPAIGATAAALFPPGRGAVT